MGVKITPAQQHILNQMRRGYILSSSLDTKYRFLNMPAEHGGRLLNPVQCTMKPVLLSTIKAMLNKGMIIEEKRFSTEGFCDGQETETWHITYKLAETLQKGNVA